MHQENVELYKKLDLIRKENAELQMKVEIQNLCWNALSFTLLFLAKESNLHYWKKLKNIQWHTRKTSPHTKQVVQSLTKTSS